MTATQRKAHIREQNTKKIIYHAEELFAKKGFNGTTTQEIADRSCLPKANIHYYFKTKRELYTVVLKDTLSKWMGDADIFQETSDPEVALRAYIRRKMEHSFSRPNGSKVWAMEIIQGGPVFGDEMKEILIEWDKKIVKSIQKWVKQKKIRQVDPQTLLNMIWATTQHYADFDFQIKALNAGKKHSKKAREDIIESVCNIILTGVLF